MKFFVPNVKDVSLSEAVYIGIAKHNGVEIPPSDKRIASIEFVHNSQHMVCTVGESLPEYYREGSGLILAIFEKDKHYIVCSPSRGGLGGVPILAGKPIRNVEYFDDVASQDSH